MITADQILAHAIGDYILQSHWMATEKTKRSVAALVHVLTYAIPFLFLRPSLLALAVIIGSHFVIDRWRLARYLVWAKNWVCPFWDNYVPDKPILERYRWNTPKPTSTGYTPDSPAWLSVWLLIIADNCLHVLCNALALRYL
jgi:hypothetical protein